MTCMIRSGPLRWVLLGAASMLAMVCSAASSSPSVDAGQPPHGNRASSELVAVAGQGAGDEASQGASPNDTDEEYRRRLGERAKRRRRTGMIVLLGALLLIALYLWSWGKLHHRTPRL